MTHVISYQQALSELTRQRLRGGAEINFTIPVIFFLCKYQGGGGGWGRSHRSKFIKSTNNCTGVKPPVNMFSNLCN